MSASVNTLQDLKAVTGLKLAYAKECFDAFGGYAPALASFAQSYASLPQSYFDDYELASRNARQINDELRAIYRCARELKAKTGKPDEEVWRTYHSSVPVANASAGAAAFGFGFPPTSAGPAMAASPFNAGAASAVPVSFGFGAKAPAGAPSALPFGAAPTSGGDKLPTLGFGAAPKPGATGATSQSPFTFGVTTAAPAKAAADDAEAAAEKPADKKPPKYCEAKHFTGPYFEMPDFWATEVVARAPLLNLNQGFLEANKETLRARLEKWIAMASFHRRPVRYVVIEDEDEDVIRVIIKDADRTFFEPAHRKKMVAFLVAMFMEFGAYGQAMSYLAGMCMLVMNEEETAAVLRFVSKQYIPGHWAAEAVGFATSAWVVEHFMKQLYPDVAKHLQSLNFWPDTYLQKILTGLCIHVLPFTDLFDFLDAFMEGGMQYLIRFCLAIVEHFRSDILAIKASTEANKLYEIMRLDSHTADHSDVRAILDRAPSIDLGEEGGSLDLIRSKVYGEKVEPRLKRAPKTAAFEPCVECDKKRPVWFSDDIGAVCDDCKAARPELTYEKY